MENIPSPTQLAETAARILEIKTSASADAATEAAAKRMKEGDGDGGLKIIAGEVIPHDKRDVDRGLIQNLSSKRDETTQEKIEPTERNEVRRISDARKSAESARSRVVEGKITAELRESVESIVRNNTGALKELLDEARKGGAADEETAIKVVSEKILASDRFRDIIARLYTERADPKKRLTTEEDVKRQEMEVAKLEAQLIEEVTAEKLEEAKKRFENAESEMATSRTESLQLNIKTKEYERLASKYSAYQDIEDRLRVTGEGISRRIDEYRSQIEDLDRDDPDYETQVENRKNRIYQLERDQGYRDYIEAKRIVETHDRLEGEIVGLQTNIGPKQLEYERAKKDYENLQERVKQGELSPQKRKIIEAELAQKKSALADARALHEAEMIEYHRGITRIAEDAAAECLKGVFERIKTVWPEEVGKQKTLDDEVLSGAIEKLPNMYKRSKKDRKTGLKYWETDRARAQEWVEEFLEGGIEGLSTKLMAEIMPGGKLDKAGLRLRGFSNAEITVLEKRLQTEEGRKAFMKENGNKLGASAFSDYLRAGGRLNEKIVKSIMTTDTGKSFLKQVEAQIGQSNEAKAIVDTLNKAREGIKQKGWEFMKKYGWKIGLAIIALLLLLGLKGAVA